MAYELFVSLRHLSARRRQNFISLITWISVGGVAVGVMALIVVIAVMSGFGKDLRDKILGTNSHVVITSFDGGGLYDYEGVVQEIEIADGVTAAAPFILSQVMLNRRDRIAGVVIRGIDPKKEGLVSDLGGNMVEGDLSVLEKKTSPIIGLIERKVQRDGIILGQELARSLKAIKGDMVSMISPAGRMTPLGLIPRMKIFQVVGTFDSGMYEYDSNLAFISLASAQKFFTMKRQVSGIEVRVKDIDHADLTAHSIQKSLGFPYQARDWKNLNKNLFSALKMEKIVMFIILVLIILVAAFNIVSTLFMVVMEKNKDISILMAMGASRRSIMKIFTLQGLIIGILGTAIGCVGGFTIVSNLNKILVIVEKILGIDIFPRDIYYLNQLPAEIQYLDSFLIIIFSIVICLVASLYPAWRASRLDPVDGLRYE